MQFFFVCQSFPRRDLIYIGERKNLQFHSLIFISSLVQQTMLKSFSRSGMKMNTISTHHATILYWQALLEKCSYSEFIWSVLSRIRTEYRDIDIRQRHAEYLSIFTANVRKYGREILWTSTLFTQTKAQKNGILSRWRYFLLTNYFDCRAFKHFRKFLNYDCFHVFLCRKKMIAVREQNH